ncbi:MULTISPECIES: PH domain-containing protein [unclassified Gordonia (in: high G+C Gram-positive bacteria)]|uniref:PH domain-containing protein n=1 Tax=unclassified Gordonia (in: high G+C Gram-positive bacteria) TaxID=2657482 RepID=UPI001FFF2509|nr:MULTISPECIES: PH domain-containing protein [unclassified Gordonia (in: high G+C Gram-positive bacteria)]UQE73195.1 PH domain-containing protein [Gordonia sp. PP30]
MNTAAPEQRPDTDDDWVYVYRPKAIVRIVIIAIVVVIAIHVTFGLLLTWRDTGAPVGWQDQAALITIGVVISCVLLLFTRSRLRVGPRGIGVLNLVTERVYGWDEVTGMSYPEKAPWARLLFPYDEHIPVMAVQARDGDAAVAAMRRVRELQREYRPPAEPTPDRPA